MSKRRTKTPERKSNNPTKAGSKFSIESLVKDAQQNELRPNVTPDHHFLFLCLAQTLFVYCVSVGLDHYHQNHHFLNAALISFSVHWCGFAVSCFIGSCKYFDITEDAGLLYMFYSSYVASCSPAPTLRQQLVHGCAALWGVRLLAFVGGRVLVRGRDFRFDKLIQAPAYNLFAWTTGGTWCWANGFCLWVLTSNAQDKKDLDVLDYIGVFFFVVGLSIETMADLQKYNFNKNHVSGSNAKWISGGLWGWSRHPNYVGEITLWFGLSLICLGGVSSISRQNKNIVRMGLVLVTPIWSMFFLIFTSLMLLEKSGDEKFGRKGERKKTGYKKAIRQWNLYKQRTPILFPTRLPTVGDLCCFQDGGGSGEYNMIDLTNDSSGLSSSLE